MLVCNMFQPITPQAIDEQLQKCAPHLTSDERMQQVIEISASAFVAVIDRIFTSEEEKRLAIDAFKLASKDHTTVLKYAEVLSKRIAELTPEVRERIQQEYKMFVDEACNNLAVKKNE